jgi:hypothetical protein
MAIVSVLVGGVLGFLVAILALVGLQVSLITAIGLWWLIGSVAAFLLLAAMLVPNGKRKEALAAQPKQA